MARMLLKKPGVTWYILFYWFHDRCTRTDKAGHFKSFRYNIMYFMMKSWHGDIFHITGPLWGESSSHQWIPHSKGRKCRSLMFSLVLAWTCSWKKNWVASGLICHNTHIDGLVQERCNSSVLAMELHRSCAKPSIWCFCKDFESFIFIMMYLTLCIVGNVS